MSLDTYANFQAAIADHLIRTDLTTQIVDCITLFEAEAANELFRQRNQQNLTILHPVTFSQITISGAADNGSGLIRLTVNDSTDASTSNTGTVSEVSGTTEANGLWALTVIDATTIDLVGSTFTNTYTNGGVLDLVQGFIELPTDYLGWSRVTLAGQPRMDLTYVHPSLFATETLTAPVSNTPRIFTIEGDFLSIAPMTGVQAIEFLYFKRTLAVSSALNNLFTTRVDAYWNGVLEQIYRYTKDYEQANVYQQAKAAIFDQIKKHELRQDGALAIRVAGFNYGQTP